MSEIVESSIKDQKLKKKQEEKEKRKKSLEETKGAWGKLIKFAKPWYGAIIISFIFAVSATVIRLIGPRLTEDMTFYMMNMDHDAVVRVGTTLAILFSIMFLLMFIQQYIMAGATQKMSIKLRRLMSRKIHRVPLSYHDKSQTGDVLSRITTDADTVSTTLNQSIVQLISSIVMIGGAMIMMFLTNWILALASLVASIIGFVFTAFIATKGQKYFDAQQKEIGQVNAHIEEYLGGHTVVKSSNAGGKVTEKFDELNNNLYTSGWKSQFFGGMMVPMMIFLGNISFVTNAIVGGLMVISGSMGFPELVGFIIYTQLLSFNMADLGEAAMNLQRTRASAARVFQLLDEPEMADESGITNEIENVRGEVKFENLRFGYNEETGIVINNFTMDIPAGSKVAIVGPTGAGKTTLVNLLMKFYDATEGDIKIDGVSIRDLKRETVAKNFGMVLQDTWVYEATVKQNLLYNMNIDPEKEQEILDRVTKATGLEHFIKTLPQGFDTVLNDGTSISSGQKQLLTIARAMIKDAPLLILDEATSSVDTRTEIVIQRAMDELSKGHTSFIIAHRLSTIKNADIILVMDKGDIVESGNHDELMQNGGFYADLYNSQFAA